MTYDYAYIELRPGEAETVFAEVNKMGQDGWRLAFTLPVHHGFLLVMELAVEFDLGVDSEDEL